MRPLQGVEQAQRDSTGKGACPLVTEHTTTGFLTTKEEQDIRNSAKTTHEKQLYNQRVVDFANKLKACCEMILVLSETRERLLAQISLTSIIRWNGGATADLLNAICRDAPPGRLYNEIHASIADRIQSSSFHLFNEFTVVQDNFVSSKAFKGVETQHLASLRSLRETVRRPAGASLHGNQELHRRVRLPRRKR